MIKIRNKPFVFIFLAIIVTLLFCQRDSLFAQEKKTDVLLVSTGSGFGNLNPFSYTSYPASKIVHLVTQRLAERKCSGVAETGQQLQTQFDAVCQTSFSPRNWDRNDSELRLKLNQERCPHIDLKDIIYSTHMTKLVQHNPYFGYSFHLKNADTGDPYLFINGFHQRQIGEVGKYFDFPIVKVNLNDFYFSRPVKVNPELTSSEESLLRKLGNRSMAIDDLDRINNATTGIFKYKSALINQIQLEKRNLPSIDSGDSLRGIKFNYYPVLDVMWKDIRAKNIDIGLSINVGQIDSGTKKDYRLKHSDDLRSFTYFGFNYDKERNMLRYRLFHVPEFRRLFALSILTVDSVTQDQFPLNSTFSNLYHSFYAYTEQSNSREKRLLPLGHKELKKQIDNFYRRVNEYGFGNTGFVPEDKMELEIAYVLDGTLDEAHFQDIKKRLNDLWGNSEEEFSLEFDTVNRTLQWNEIKQEGDFDIIYDTFTFGNNESLYFEFMNPENTAVNFLKSDIFSAKEIKYFREKVSRWDKYLKEVEKRLPVFVLGTFYKRDIIKNTIEQQRKTCGGRSELFYGIERWGM